MAQDSQRSRASIIAAVKTRLGFLVLLLLVMETLLGTMWFNSDGNMKWALLWAILVLLVALITIVVLVDLERPGVLSGEKKSAADLGERMAVDLYFGLKGSLSNLPRAEEEEAWESVAGAITKTKSSKFYLEFCEALKRRLRELSELGSTAAPAPRGVIAKRDLL